MNICSVLLFVFLLFGISSCRVKPPHEKGNFQPTDLVELKKFDTTIHLDIRYATSNNFVGKPVYKQARAFLQRQAAEALVKVNISLKPQGYGLVVFDGYRPWSVTKLFWDATPANKKQFVADPAKGSRHNRGCAVDVSLYELATGKEITMTSSYDEMTEHAYLTYTGGTEAERNARDVLRSKMEAAGFMVYPYEWWHFDYKDWKNYSITNIPFSKIR